MVLANSIKEVELLAKDAADGFDFNSQLFLVYLKSSLMESQKQLTKGQVLTISVFGENQQFKVGDLQLGDGPHEVHAVTRETEITLKQEEDGDESTEATEDVI